MTGESICSSGLPLKYPVQAIAFSLSMHIMAKQHHCRIKVHRLKHKIIVWDLHLQFEDGFRQIGHLTNLCEVITTFFAHRKHHGKAVTLDVYYFQLDVDRNSYWYNNHNSEQ
jgi:hypothetical protein